MIETQTQISNENSIKESNVSLKLKNKKNILSKKDNKPNIKKEELKKIYDIYAETIWLTGC